MVDRISHAWRALRHRNFRLFVLGQSISLIGTWMTRLAGIWLVYRLTHSAMLLGVTGFTGQILTFLLAPFTGVWIERLDRHKILLWTQFASALQSLTLATLTLTGVITFPMVIALMAFQGLINAFDMPTRQAFVIQMLDDRNDLGNAIAINSSLVNAARLVGPALAGMIIGVAGEGVCFLVDGISYFAVIATLVMMRVKPLNVQRKTARMLVQMREGWDYVRTFRPIRTILLLFGLASLVGYPYTVLLPIFAGKVLHGGPDTLGWLTGASGFGALISALSLTLRKTVVGLTRMLQIAFAIFGAGLILFGLSRHLWLSILLMTFVGFGMTQVMAVSNTIIQTLVPEDKRARVMSYYMMMFFGMMPFGSLMAGALAHHIGAPYTLVLSGSACLAGAVWFSVDLPKVNKAIKPIYQEMGLLPTDPPAFTPSDDAPGHVRTSA